MLSMDEFVGSTNDQAVMRGKRTKRRHRPASPCAYSATSSSGGGAESTEEEEEDMANCLILLARGGVAATTTAATPQERSSTRRFTEIMADSAVKVGFYVYECKTCNRTFSSFQALGGHRASHKRPKAEKEVVVAAATAEAEEEKIRSEIAAVNHVPFAIPIAQSSTIAVDREQSDAGNRRSPPLSLQFGHHHDTTTAVNQRSSFNSTTKPNKTHECSICGSEFTSGQALGGHMRRHRAAAVASAATTAATSTDSSAAEEEKRPRNILQLDLNLPAPEDDLRESKFQFSSAKQSIVFSTVPALVDCHY